MKKGIIIGCVVLLLELLATQAWSHGRGGFGGGLSGHPGVSHFSGGVSPWGGLHGSFSHPGGQGFSHFDHFQHDQFFGPHHHVGPFVSPGHAEHAEHELLFGPHHHFGGVQSGFFFESTFAPVGLQVVVITTPSYGLPPPPQCGPEAHWDATLRRCRRNVPLSSCILILGKSTIFPLRRCRRNVPLSSSLPQILSPPPGIIVLRPGGIREPAEACPGGFIEQVAKGRRFCVDPQHPEPGPPLLALPIAGIPAEEARKIRQRQRGELLLRPGGKDVGLEGKGLYVETDAPAATLLPPPGPAPVSDSGLPWNHENPTPPADVQMRNAEREFRAGRMSLEEFRQIKKVLRGE